DTVFRRIWYTSRQAVQRWGDNLPEKIKESANNNSGTEKQWEFLHCVKPREERDPTRRDSINMPFASYYISMEQKMLIDEGGFQTLPYAVSRYVTGPGETYGRSPAMTALPSIKTLNEQKKTILKQGHRVTDPVLLSHDDGVIGTFSMRPGALNPGSMTADGKRLVDVLPTGNIAAGIEMQNEERKVINDVFLVNLFQILVDTPQMTATEVLERTREKGILLAPTLGRQQDEKLGPMITREVDLLSRQGLLPPMPDIMREAGGEFEVRYDSPLSRAQRAEEAAGLFRSMEFAAGYANATGDIAVFDHIDVDAAMPDVMAINAVPVKWRSSLEQVQATRGARAEAAEQQQDIEALPAVAGLAKAQQ
ncbi:MAG: phage head-tail adapter protein, partial [Planctomycetes bacterium]|nr:phage head-tail adapter protein [Planctomycetota bacterium]